MRVAPGLFLLVLASSVGASAQSPQVERIDVVEHGNYTASLVSAADAKGIAQNTVNNIQHGDTTRSVPAELGLRFGFRYTVDLRNPVTNETISRSESTVTRNVGVVGYTGYGFDFPWELAPGPWTMKLWLGDRRLASQTFTVTKP